jgi:predicted transposase/invertase (TIGR01784 family)
MAKLEYTFKNDTLFKSLFVQHPGLLKRLVAELLTIPLGSITRFEVTNPEMPPESMGDKFCRLDINMTVDGDLVDLEVQVKNEGDFPERTLFHWAREYSSSLPSGGKYHELPRVVIISIIAFPLFEGEEYYHSEFQPLEVTRHTRDYANLMARVRPSPAGGRRGYSKGNWFPFEEARRAEREHLRTNAALLWRCQ